MTLDTVDCGGDWLSWRKRPLKVNYNNNNGWYGGDLHQARQRFYKGVGRAAIEKLT